MSNSVVRTGTILDKIILDKRNEICDADARRPSAELKAICKDLPPTRDFMGALQKDTVALIAEVKHASPSKGVLIEDFDPVRIAQMYAEHGAAAISVLTDEKYFQGHLRYLEQIHDAVTLPLLRKEFTIGQYQVYEARAAGADAILLIVAALEDNMMADLHALATELGLAALVEVHNEGELERALMLKPPLVGINNRNLHDFSVDLNTTRQLAQGIPAGTVIVGESGIASAQDVRALGPIHAILVGETVVTDHDRPAKVRELSQVPRHELSITTK